MLFFLDSYRKLLVLPWAQRPVFLHREKPGGATETGGCLCECVTPNLVPHLQNGDCRVRSSPMLDSPLLSLKLQWTRVNLLVLQVQKLALGVLRWFGRGHVSGPASG